MTTESTPAGLGLSDQLGLNRAGNALLCYAWGESDRPVFHAAHSLQDVRKFVVEQWLGSDDAEDYDGENSLARILDTLAEHDWRDDGELVWTFEIGGMKLVDAFEAYDEMDRLRAIARDAETAATDFMREILGVRRYCSDVQQNGTVNERAVAQTVARMLARPPAA